MSNGKNPEYHSNPVAKCSQNKHRQKKQSVISAELLVIRSNLHMKGRDYQRTKSLNLSSTSQTQRKRLTKEK